MRIKRQKLRRLTELYPGVNVRLWSRKDFDHLLQRFGITDRRHALVGKEAVEDNHEDTE
jgi:hypothetical protein